MRCCVVASRIVLARSPAHGTRDGQPTTPRQRGRLSPASGGPGALEVGRTVVTPKLTVTDGLADLPIALGGYTHPLFNDIEFIRSHTRFQGCPIPGEATPLLLGGPAEQSATPEGINVILTGIEQVRFRRPALVGTQSARPLGGRPMPWSGRNWLRGEMRPLSGLAQPISRVPSLIPVSDPPRDQLAPGRGNPAEVTTGRPVGDKVRIVLAVLRREH